VGSSFHSPVFSSFQLSVVAMLADEFALARGMNVGSETKVAGEFHRLFAAIRLSSCGAGNDALPLATPLRCTITSSVQYIYSSGPFASLKVVLLQCRNRLMMSAGWWR